MSWMAKLDKTYEQGVKLDMADNLPAKEKLMPISHTLQNAHINIVIDNQGNFKSAKVLEKTQIILPATESSAGRSSGGAPHPLADKLQYVAMDYADYGGNKTAYFNDFCASSKTEGDYDYIDSQTQKPMRDGYKTQLKKWCDSPFSHPKAQAVYRYIEKGCVIADLIKAGIIYVNDENVLLTKWPHEVTTDNPLPKLFKILPKEKFDQGSALVCWTVETIGDPNSDTWNDKSLQESWIAFDASRGTEKGLCYVSGTEQPLAINHPAKLRHTGDKAKLISSNDLSGFTYRGRFIDAGQACGVGFNVTQKAHNALRWLIAREGSYQNGDQVIVAWAVSGKAIPPLMSATYEFVDFENLEEIKLNEEIGKNNKIDHSHDLGQSFAIKLKEKMKGYHAKLGDFENIIVMAIDSATPGRMGITYYQEFFSKEFIDQIEKWYIEFAWQQRGTKLLDQADGKKSKPITIWPISAPVPHAIAQAAYGKTLTDSLKKKTINRLLPCIVEGSPLPIDILNACINRVSNPNSSERWEWERDLRVACALYRGFYCRHPNLSKRRTYSMSLETDNTSRDYLYGRLLAVAERIERHALDIAGEKNRSTNAERLMQRFAEKPFSTWTNIELKLRPYMDRLQANRPGFLVNRNKELREIMDLFNSKEFTNDKKLSGEFLLGYHCQVQSGYAKPESDNGAKEV